MEEPPIFSRAGFWAVFFLPNHSLRLPRLPRGSATPEAWPEDKGSRQRGLRGPGRVGRRPTRKVLRESAEPRERGYVRVVLHTSLESQRECAVRGSGSGGRGREASPEAAEGQGELRGRSRLQAQYYTHTAESRPGAHGIETIRTRQVGARPPRSWQVPRRHPTHNNHRYTHMQGRRSLDTPPPVDGLPKTETRDTGFDCPKHATQALTATPCNGGLLWLRGAGPEAGCGGPEQRPHHRPCQWLPRARTHLPLPSLRSPWLHRGGGRPSSP